VTEPKSKSTPRLVLALICTGIGVGVGYGLALLAEHHRLDHNKALVLMSHRLWSMGDEAAMTKEARQILAPDFVVHDWTGDTTGLDPFITGIKENRAMFPDWVEKVDVLIAEGDLVAARFTSTGTQARDIPAVPHLQPTVPNKGRFLRMPEMEVFRIANGKLVEQWDLNDGWSANAQLGLFDPDRWRESVCGTLQKDVLSTPRP
jgi:predicted ester cyclase